MGGWEGGLMGGGVFRTQVHLLSRSWLWTYRHTTLSPFIENRSKVNWLFLLLEFSAYFTILISSLFYDVGILIATFNLWMKFSSLCICMWNMLSTPSCLIPWLLSVPLTLSMAYFSPLRQGNPQGVSEPILHSHLHMIWSAPNPREQVSSCIGLYSNIYV